MFWVVIDKGPQALHMKELNGLYRIRLAWKILTTLVPSEADTKKNGSLRLAAKLKLFEVT